MSLPSVLVLGVSDLQIARMTLNDIVVSETFQELQHDGVLIDNRDWITTAKGPGWNNLNTHRIQVLLYVSQASALASVFLSQHLQDLHQNLSLLRQCNLDTLYSFFQALCTRSLQVQVEIEWRSEATSLWSTGLFTQRGRLRTSRSVGQRASKVTVGSLTNL